MKRERGVADDAHPPSGSIPIVINTAPGGFRLSTDGMKRFLELKGLEYTTSPIPPREEDKDYVSFYVGGSFFSTTNIHRDDPCLVQVIQEMGDRATAGVSQATIAYVEWQIEQEDGKEWVTTSAHWHQRGPPPPVGGGQMAALKELGGIVHSNMLYSTQCSPAAE